ncbi:MAG: fibronectin type III domain-containing protein [Candidatus Sulfotelmatobacter sp.]
MGNYQGGTDQHYGIVHFGTNPNELNQTAKYPIHLNREHSDTVFRVRVLGLAPQTTYYYTVESTEATGANDGEKSGVKQFSTQ